MDWKVLWRWLEGMLAFMLPALIDYVVSEVGVGHEIDRSKLLLFCLATFGAWMRRQRMELPPSRPSSEVQKGGDASR